MTEAVTTDDELAEPAHVGTASPSRFSQIRIEPSPALRALLGGLYLGVFVVIGLKNGWPLNERPLILAWLMGGAFIATVGRRGGGLTVLKDWLPYGLAMTAYDFSRGAADGLGMPLQQGFLINVDKALFLGKVPNVELQRWLGPYTDDIRWWELPVAWTYATHFVVPFVIPMVLWVSNRQRFRQWRNRFFTVVAAGLTTYILLPSVPPWMASKNGALPPLERTANRGWRGLGVQFADRVWNQGSAVYNTVAALPSLHGAFAALTTVFFWQSAPRSVRPILVVYPLLMLFTLVASAEHYVFDILLGWVYVLIACVAWDRIEARRSPFEG